MILVAAMYVNVLQQYAQTYVTKNSTTKNSTLNETFDCAELVANYTNSNITESDAVKFLRAEGNYQDCQNYFNLYIWQTYFVYVLPQIIQIFTGIAK
jgi:hypothetical protein